MKKSFILYNDICNVFEDLSDEQAGLLIKEIIKFNQNLVTQNNPNNPSGLSGLLKAVFTPFKHHLIRDYEKWVNKRNANISNGKLGGRPKKEPTVTQLNPKKGVNVNVNVNDNVNVNKEKENIKEKKQKFGKFKNVLLTEKEYLKLKKDWGEKELKRMMVIFSEGLQMKNYKYKSHNLAIRKWKNNEIKKQNPKNFYYEDGYEKTGF